MSEYKFKKAMRILDHAIDSLGVTKPCMLLVQDGKMYNVPSTASNADAARAILVSAMCQLVREQSL